MDFALGQPKVTHVVLLTHLFSNFEGGCFSSPPAPKQDHLYPPHLIGLKEPWRENIYQLVCSVEDFSTRFKRSDLCMPILSILSDDMRNINFLGSTPFSFRFSDETLGFLLPLAASGKKIQVRPILLNFSWSKLISPLHNWSQVFCGTMDLTDHASKDNN